jgi:hypothetical protein
MTLKSRAWPLMSHISPDRGHEVGLDKGRQHLNFRSLANGVRRAFRTTDQFAKHFYHDLDGESKFEDARRTPFARLRNPRLVKQVVKTRMMTLKSRAWPLMSKFEDVQATVRWKQRVMITLLTTSAGAISLSRAIINVWRIDPWSEMLDGPHLPDSETQGWSSKSLRQENSVL